MGPMKLGVFGGSFNPVHHGHLHLARCAQRLFGLQQIHFVVAESPPHKPVLDLVPFAHRYAMVCMATAGYPALVPSLVELEHPTSPFSVHTMEKIARRYAGRSVSLYFIAGGDSLLDVRTWREGEQLLSSYSFVFALRPGVELDEINTMLPAKAKRHVCDLRRFRSRSLRERIKAEEVSREKRIFIVDVAAPDISASRIRELAAAGKRIRHLVPAPVHEYIQKLHLYGE